MRDCCRKISELMSMLKSNGNRAVVTGGGRLPPRLCIATGGSAHDVTHSITSIIQSFVNKCNNSNSCKLFYSDYKSMLIHKLPQTLYAAFPLDWQF